MRGTAPQTPRSVQMERENMLQAPEQRFHCPHWKSVSPHEEQAAETMCDKLTAALIPHLPVLLRRGGGREIRSEIEPREEGRDREDLLLFLTSLL